MNGRTRRACEYIDIMYALRGFVNWNGKLIRPSRRIGNTVTARRDITASPDAAAHQVDGIRANLFRKRAAALFVYGATPRPHGVSANDCSVPVIEPFGLETILS
jgi:hypothetical protein